MVNGSAGPAAELHHGDLFQRDLFQEDLKELRVEEHSDSEERGGVNEKEKEEEKDEESPKAGEDEKQKHDALDDLYTDMYSLSSLAKPWESNVRVKTTWIIIRSTLTVVLNVDRHSCKA